MLINLVNSVSPFQFSTKTQRAKSSNPVLSVLKNDSVSFSANQSPEVRLEKTRAFMLRPLEKGYVLPALNINNMESTQAVMAAAVAKRSPLIIQVSAGARDYAGGAEKLAGIFKALKTDMDKQNVPVILHLDHGKTAEDCIKCVDAGFDSVMVDASDPKHYTYEDNKRVTKQVVDYAHKRGVFVEAELGAIAGTEDNVSVSAKEASFTDPEQAADFVKATGCDSLAVSIGTAHGPVKFAENEKPKLDFERLQKIKDAIEKILPENQGKSKDDPTWRQYPLVLHGASSAPKDLVNQVNKFFVISRELGNNLKNILTGQGGDKQEALKQLDKFSKPRTGKGVPEEMYSQTVGLVAKLNVDTDLRMGVTALVKEKMAEKPDEIDPRWYLKAARSMQQKIAERKMDMLGSSGQV